MNILRKSTGVRVPVRLITGGGLGATGITPGVIQGGIATVIKSDGTTVDITLSLGVNLFEVHNTKAKGLYHLLLTSSHTDTLGPLQWVVLPAATQFTHESGFGEATVEDLAPLILQGAVNTDGAAPAGSAAAALRLIKQFLAGRVKLDAGTKQYLIYKEDATTALSTRDTKDAAAASSADPVYEWAP